MLCLYVMDVTKWFICKIHACSEDSLSIYLYFKAKQQSITYLMNISDPERTDHSYVARAYMNFTNDLSRLSVSEI